MRFFFLGQKVLGHWNKNSKYIPPNKKRQSLKEQNKEGEAKQDSTKTSKMHFPTQIVTLHRVAKRAWQATRDQNVHKRLWWLVGPTFQFYNPKSYRCCHVSSTICIPWHPFPPDIMKSPAKTLNFFQEGQYTSCMITRTSIYSFDRTLESVSTTMSV